jgi:hypothetical protein
MIRYLLVSNGIGVVILWWVVADLSLSTRVVSGGFLLAALLTLFVAAGRRARQLRSQFEGYAPQVIRHDGGFGRRRRPKDGEDPEIFVTDRW